MLLEKELVELKLCRWWFERCIDMVIYFFTSPVNVSESLEESAAAYTKATAKKCILEKVDVKTGEESESNVLQVKQNLCSYYLQ